MALLAAARAHRAFADQDLDAAVGRAPGFVVVAGQRVARATPGHAHLTGDSPRATSQSRALAARSSDSASLPPAEPLLSVCPTMRSSSCGWREAPRPPCPAAWSPRFQRRAVGSKARSPGSVSHRRSSVVRASVIGVPPRLLASWRSTSPSAATSCAPRPSRLAVVDRAGGGAGHRGGRGRQRFHRRRAAGDQQGGRRGADRCTEREESGLVRHGGNVSRGARIGHAP